MIPRNRPVIGRDLQVFQRENGLTIDDARYLFGLTMNKWCEIANKCGDEPISNTAVALLVRLYDEFPHLIPEQPRLSPVDLYELLQGLDKEYTSKKLELILGRDGSNGTRWLKQGGAAGPMVERLAWHLWHDILRKRSAGLRKWEGIVAREAKARGVKNLWKKGSWS